MTCSPKGQMRVLLASPVPQILFEVQNLVADGPHEMAHPFTAPFETLQALHGCDVLQSMIDIILSISRKGQFCDQH